MHIAAELLRDLRRIFGAREDERFALSGMRDPLDEKSIDARTYPEREEIRFVEMRANARGVSERRGASSERLGWRVTGSGLAWTAGPPPSTLRLTG